MATVNFGSVFNEDDIRLRAYCTRIQLRFMHCETFEAKHWNIKERCNKYIQSVLSKFELK